MEVAKLIPDWHLYCDISVNGNTKRILTGKMRLKKV